MTEIRKLDSFLETRIEESLEELAGLCAQPSVSATQLGIVECAQMTADMLRKRGFEVEIIPTQGAPVVFAERKGRADKTLLFYNHYDVQPPEPLELWDTPPFVPSRRDGLMFARGVNDDKGHFVYRLHTIDAFLAEEGELPCNIKFVLEGEEEIGSPHLHEFLKENYQKLTADACIWEFGEVNYEEQPLQSLGLRGMAYVELRVTTANQDVHSGLGGSIFPNAAWRLVWALNSLKGPDNRIRIPGFYDRVKPPSNRDIALIEKLPETSVEYKKRYGVKEFIKGLTKGVELRVAEVFEPTCTICGITSGYQGPGSKTVLPAQASAKVDFRLVPDQKPEEILQLLRKHLDNEGFEDVEIHSLGGEEAGRTDPDDPFVKLVIETAGAVYDKPMLIEPMIGGSGPNSLFIKYLNLPVVSAGLGHPGAQIHAPNENMRVDLYLKAAKHLVRILKRFSE
jgi:acetylornithine deacetylase/succinyl-diaminopimelate desuccinylase-like protein